eukprot:TRINITY_DN33221_c0_g1_i1.p1 TRINITY_DN33221_c0_g1~~TRINITY_DN33221_c0_g1_i1.p1  ORF type:complete len:365 (-),score=66.05 TRINITY_DN33221_c0_g1_i1:504-1511(-)
MRADADASPNGAAETLLDRRGLDMKDRTASEESSQGSQGSLRFASCSELDTAADAAEDEGEHDDYYAFLREMAGSFAGGVGSDDDVSEDESSEEGEAHRSVFAAHSSTGRCDNSSGCPASYTASSRWQGEQSFGMQSLCSKEAPRPEKGETGSGLSEVTTAADRGSHDSPEKTEDVKPCHAALSCDSTSATKTADSTQATCGVRRDDTSAADALMSKIEADDTWPLNDKRLPVQDDYDVDKALDHFAQQHTVDAVTLQRACLSRQIEQKMSQIKQLAGLTTSRLIRESLKGHYARVREELSTEAKVLEGRLAQFEKDASSGLVSGIGGDCASVVL